MSKDCGFREVQHTADWALEVWAPNLPGLLEQAARGMLALQNIQLEPDPRVSRAIELDAFDAESLLVKFLNELLYQNGLFGLGFDTFAFTIEGEHLLAQLGGARIISQAKEIKAVTYHNLEIRHNERGLETRIVFDV